ncbi:hypothetical protein [Streptomyces sp. NPDC060194]|uniref:hypothetical protein n=1 Tax=Streptomyces sp. NPDC060194 TaxID=3347069 RepID=UPI003661405F
MFDYEFHKIQSAELIRAAQEHRLAREVTTARRRAARAARRSGGHDPEGRVSAAEALRRRFTHAA